MIEILDTTVYRGPNTWVRVPVIKLLINIGELEDRPSNTIPGFADRLVELLPSLREHVCSRGYRGGFVARLHEGARLGHVLKHVALNLQTLAGATVNRCKTRWADYPGCYHAVCA